MKKAPAYLNYSSLYEWNTKTDVFDNGYSKMKPSERVAYKFLLNMGYRQEQIIYDSRRSPDFKTYDNNWWEVKTLQNNNIVFTVHQCLMKMETKILLVFPDNNIQELIFSDIIYLTNTKFVQGYGGYMTYDGAIIEMEAREKNEHYWQFRINK